MRFFKPVVCLVVIIAIAFFLSWDRAPELSDPLKTVTTPGTYTSMPYNEFRKLIPDRLGYINDNSTFLEPYDKQKLEFIRDNFSDRSDEELIAMMLAVPNLELGYYRLEPIGTPEDYTSYQFEQGSTGWFWIYGTFVNDEGKTASYMYYFLRLDMFPPDLRNAMNLPLGSTTYYSICGAVGVEGEWRYTPLKFCRGEYKIESPDKFSFTALDLPQNWEYSLEMNGTGNFKIVSKWEDDSLKAQGFSAELNALRQPFLDNPGGCSPCIGGAGTLYFSYTQLETSAEMTLDDSTSTFTGGTGWVDRQWMNRQVSNVFMSLLSNTESMFSNQPRGLGKYVWMNLHLGDELQYMFSGIFNESEEITNGTKFKPIINRYGKDGPEYQLSGEAEVTETVVINKTEFPTKYNLRVENENYILDAAKFPNSVSIDPSNNLHWNGSGLVYNEKGEMIGTGFLEANQFTPQDIYMTNYLAMIGIEDNAANVNLFTNKGSLSLSQGLPSFLVLLLCIVSILVCLIILVKSFFRKRKIA